MAKRKADTMAEDERRAKEDKKAEGARRAKEWAEKRKAKAANKAKAASASGVAAAAKAAPSVSSPSPARKRKQVRASRPTKTATTGTPKKRTSRSTPAKTTVPKSTPSRAKKSATRSTRRSAAAAAAAPPSPEVEEDSDEEEEASSPEPSPETTKSTPKTKRRRIEATEDGLRQEEVQHSNGRTTKKTETKEEKKARMKRESDLAAEWAKTLAEKKAGKMPSPPKENGTGAAAASSRVPPAATMAHQQPSRRSGVNFASTSTAAAAASATTNGVTHEANPPPPPARSLRAFLVGTLGGRNEAPQGPPHVPDEAPVEEEEKVEEEEEPIYVSDEDGEHQVVEPEADGEHQGRRHFGTLVKVLCVLGVIFLSNALIEGIGPAFQGWMSKGGSNDPSAIVATIQESRVPPCFKDFPKKPSGNDESEAGTGWWTEEPPAQTSGMVKNCLQIEQQHNNDTVTPREPCPPHGRCARGYLIDCLGDGEGGSIDGNLYEVSKSTFAECVLTDKAKEAIAAIEEALKNLTVCQWCNPRCRFGEKFLGFGLGSEEAQTESCGGISRADVMTGLSENSDTRHQFTVDGFSQVVSALNGISITTEIMEKLEPHFDQEIVEYTRGTKPHLIALTPDFVNGHLSFPTSCWIVTNVCNVLYFLLSFFLGLAVAYPRRTFIAVVVVGSLLKIRIKAKRNLRISQEADRLETLARNVIWQSGPDGDFVNVIRDKIAKELYPLSRKKRKKFNTGAVWTRVVNDLQHDNAIEVRLRDGKMCWAFTPGELRRRNAGFMSPSQTNRTGTPTDTSS